MKSCVIFVFTSQEFLAHFAPTTKHNSVLFPFQSIWSYLWNSLCSWKHQILTSCLLLWNLQWRNSRSSGEGCETETGPEGTPGKRGLCQWYVMLYRKRSSVSIVRFVIQKKGSMSMVGYVIQKKGSMCMVCYVIRKRGLCEWYVMS